MSRVLSSQRSLTVSKIEIYMTILFVVLIRPAYINTISVLSRAWSYAQLLVLIYALFVFLFKRLSLPVRILGGIYGLFILSAAINHVELMDTIQKFTPYLCLAILCDYWIKRYGMHTLNALHFVLLVYTFINFATIIVFPQGLYLAQTSGKTVVACWFLGYKNPQIRTLLLALVLEYMFNYRPRKRLKIRTIVVTFVIAATLAYIKSATALFAFVVYLLLVFLLQKKNSFLMKVISPSGIIIMFVVVTLLVVVVDVLPYISGITAAMFSGKDVATGSDRIYVWKAAIEIIKNHFLFGIGETNFKTVISVFSVTHPHNYLLFQWLSGGVGAVILSVLFFHSTLKEMFKRKARFEYRLFIAATIVVFIMGVVESLTEFPLLYAIFVIGYNLNRIYPDEIKGEPLPQ